MRGLKHEGLYIAPHFLDPSSLQSLIFSCEGSYGPALLFLKPLIRLFPRIGPHFSISFFSWLAHFSGKADVSLS